MTPRLRFLISKTLPGQALWDIGCDHGLLAEAALWSGEFSAVHFVDPLEHQIQSARLRVANHPRLKDRPVFFHAVKGEHIPMVLTGSAVIAGMGGETMISILRQLRQLGRLQIQRLVLSAHKDSLLLREYLLGLQGLILVEQTSFQERGRLRPVDVWDLDSSAGAGPV